MEHVKHSVIIGGKLVKIWNENGIVKQSGRFDLPEDIEVFNGTNKSMEAGAFISGILWANKNNIGGQ